MHIADVLKSSSEHLEGFVSGSAAQRSGNEIMSKNTGSKGDGRDAAVQLTANTQS